MAKKDNERYEIDPVDGLKREIVGDWCREKHQRLKHYIDITRATRRKFSHNNPSYVDLYCATGRARIRDSVPEEVIDGSALVAASAAQGDYAFTDMFIGDVEQENLSCCESRLRAAGAKQAIHALHGSAEETARKVVASINKYGLHLAFLDPYNIDSLPFSVIETLGGVQRMDMILHLSENDLQRNVIGKREFWRLDAFCPGWENHVETSQPQHVIKHQILTCWKNKLTEIGYRVSDNIERVRGGKNQPLYWLVLAARNDLADKFWSQVSNTTPQGRFGF